MSALIQRLERAQLGRLPGSAEEWLVQLAGPTLLRIPGRDRTRTRALVTLLHGDEPSGTRALHAWLRSGAVPATDALCYLGSITAALDGERWAQRMLPSARDANRCFREPWSSREGALARELLESLEAARPEALIDLHNSSGKSPAYGVGTAADSGRLGLTALFADHFMLSDLRLGTLIEAAERFVTCVVVECGRALDPVADAVALAGLERYLLADTLHFDAACCAAIDVLQHPIRVQLQPDAHVVFADARVDAAQLTLRNDIDRHNLDTLAPGTLLGWLGGDGHWPFDARGKDGVEVSDKLFTCSDGLLRTRRALVPVMMTPSMKAARSDCLFYALERR